MNIEFKCPQCGQIVETDESLNGKTTECPYCKNSIVVEGAASQSSCNLANGNAMCGGESVSGKVKDAAKTAYDKMRNVDIKKVAEDMHGKFNSFAGLEKLEGFSLRDLLADIFKHHNKEDVENFFTVGTITTTPTIEQVDTTWPRPWIFFRALSFSAIVYFLFNVAWETFKNINLIPGLLAIGTVAVPVSALIFFFEVNVRRNVSLYFILRLVMLGGVLSLIFSLILFELPLANIQFLGASIAGLIEEPGKLLALLVIARSTKYGYKINGLLMGAAIGAGFAIFESMGYAFRALLITTDKGFMTDVILLRGVLSPFAHIAWTAICGAALWRVKGNNSFSFGMLANGKFWHLFLVPVILHMVWNAKFSLPYHLKNIGLGLIAWIIILALIQEGLKEIRQEKVDALKCHNAVT